MNATAQWAAMLRDATTWILPIIFAVTFHEAAHGFVANRLGDEDPDSPRPTGWVPCTYLWMVDGDEYLGAISLRHSLDNPFLAELGGHIGYSVRPSARRRGHAVDALRQAVELAGARGIDRVLVTCDEDNVASARTIESAGGRHEDTRQGRRRYWIVTGH